MAVKKTTRVDVVIICVLLTMSLVVAWRPVKRSEPANKIELAALVPVPLGPWAGRTFDTSDYADKWQSINTLLVRDYAKPNLFSFRSPATQVSFVLEYSSDLRQNFSFHFPENCHRAGGNEVQFLSPAEVDLGDGRVLRAKRIYIKGLVNSGEPQDKIVTYWLVMDGKQYYKTFFIKLDQMLSGLLSKAKSGFLVRVDYWQELEYSPEGIDKAARVTQEFIRDLYDVLSPEARSQLFGEER